MITTLQVSKLTTIRITIHHNTHTEFSTIPSNPLFYYLISDQNNNQLSLLHCNNESNRNSILTKMDIQMV